MEHCRAFKGAELASALFQLVVTTALFTALISLMFYGFNREIYELPLLLMLPAAGLLVRIFIIQHDCGHGSFFKTRLANDITGRVLSLLTFTPYDAWRRAHNLHHASSGNLSNRGIGSIDTLTVKEFQALPPRQKLSYTIYRNPLILLLFATPFFVIFVQRIPSLPAMSYFADYKNLTAAQTWRSVIGLNVALIIFYGTLMAFFGWKPFLFVFMPVVAITSSIGGWLFFIQHQFEDSYWHRKDEWDFETAALHGSSYYVLPKVLQWFSGNIGLHHIHHLCPAIPNYKLQRCLDADTRLQNLNRMTMWDSFKCAKLALWDEDRRKMISFKEMRKGLQTA